jgi:hypothetical protein
VNLLQLETAVANETGLSLSIAAEKTLIDDALNVGVQRVLEDTHCYVKRVDFSSFDGTSLDYTIDAAILEIKELYLTSGSTLYPLERITESDMIQRRLLGQPSGTPVQVYAVSGANLLMFWPAPGAADTLAIYNVPIPTPLSSPTDDPSSTSPTNFGGVPSILHEAIFYHACRKAASYDDDQSSAQGQRYSDWYDKEITRYRGIIRKRGGDRNARAVVNDKRRRRAFHTNDIYPRY